MPKSAVFKVYSACHKAAAENFVRHCFRQKRGREIGKNGRGADGRRLHFKSYAGKQAYGFVYARRRFGYDAAPQHKKMAFGLAKNGYTVVLPHYRLLPNNKYPAAKEDALEAHAWTLGNLSDHVAVMGDSAGGTLAAYVALCAEKRGLKPPCCQLLFYPLTDLSMSSESMKKYEKAPLWCAANNRKLLEMYGAAGAAAEAFPLTATLPSVIVPSYIETAEHDCLSDEGAAFSDRLEEAGGETVLVRTKGTMHGYAGAQNSRLLKELQRSRLEFLSKFEK